MNLRASAIVAFAFALGIAEPLSPSLASQSQQQRVFGYSDFTAESKIEQQFLAIPDPHQAATELKALSAEPHLAGTPEDRAVAEYIARKFRAAGLTTEIIPYRVLLDQPKLIRVEAYDSAGHLLMSGPTPEHVNGDSAPDDPRIVVPFNSSSGSGDVTGDIVYANYGRIEDFNDLAARRIDLHGKIVLCRYGTNFRGVKVHLAEQRGAIGVLLYSDPIDDGSEKGETWPMGPWRPDTAVQRGSVQYLFKYPGDPETPGIASTPDLPDSARVSPYGDQPRIISIPISAHDAEPILRALKGPNVPRDWQGALPFRYHIGPNGVRVHLVAEQDYRRRLIYDVIGKVAGSQDPDSWVLVGSHHDAWVYGAVDPGSGGAAMLESLRGVGALLKQGWRPARTIVFCSWDAEEQGLIGSTEWVEQQGRILDHAVAYFNVDVAVSGPEFSANSVPSLKGFLRDIARSVPSPLGGTVYQQWLLKSSSAPAPTDNRVSSASPVVPNEPALGDLGSGSDYTPFLQHAGVPSTDIESSGPYGVYHSAFDDFAWYTQNADPHFLYLQQMARFLGLQVLRMADADALPFDYQVYAREISAYLAAAKRKAADSGLSAVDFAPAQAAAARFFASAERVYALQSAPSGNLARFNLALRQAESALLSDAGLPNRPWYRHTIYAPGEDSGYSAVVIPGVNEAIDARNAPLTGQQLDVLAHALDHATSALDNAR